MQRQCLLKTDWRLALIEEFAVVAYRKQNRGRQYTGTFFGLHSRPLLRCLLRDGKFRHRTKLIYIFVLMVLGLVRARACVNFFCTFLNILVVIIRLLLSLRLQGPQSRNEFFVNITG